MVVTMAFSKAERVMMSRGRMFCSRRFRIAEPTEAHSSNFSVDSAGYDDEPVSVMPRASAALAIVLAVYIYEGEQSVSKVAGWKNKII